jgi:DNA-binding NarL/FixJ family response regulator
MIPKSNSVHQRHDDSPATARRAEAPCYRARLVDTDDVMRGLLDEWLAALGCTVVAEPGADAAPPKVDLVIVDVPFPRQGGSELVQRVARQHPGTPILALSPNFFSGIECCGPVARALGVDCVLPKPATREALATAVRLVLPL